MTSPSKQTRNGRDRQSRDPLHDIYALHMTQRAFTLPHVVCLHPSRPKYMSKKHLPDRAQLSPRQQWLSLLGIRCRTFANSAEKNAAEHVQLGRRRHVNHCKHGSLFATCSLATYFTKTISAFRIRLNRSLLPSREYSAINHTCISHSVKRYYTSITRLMEQSYSLPIIN